MIEGKKIKHCFHEINNLSHWQIQEYFLKISILAGKYLSVGLKTYGRHKRVFSRQFLQNNDFQVISERGGFPSCIGNNKNKISSILMDGKLGVKS